MEPPTVLSVKATVVLDLAGQARVASLPWANDFAVVTSAPVGPLALPPPPVPVAPGPFDPKLAATIAAVVHPEQKSGDLSSLLPP